MNDPRPPRRRELEDLGLALGEAVKDDAVPVDAAGVDRLHALAERAARMDDDRATQPPRDGELGLERRPLQAEGPRGLPGLLRQVEPVQAALAQGDGRVALPALPESRHPGDGGLPSPVHGARVQADRVPDAPPVLPGEVSVELPVVRGRPDGDHPFDAGDARALDEARQSPAPCRGVQVGVGVDEGQVGAPGAGRPRTSAIPGARSRPG